MRVRIEIYTQDRPSCGHASERRVRYLRQTCEHACSSGCVAQARAFAESVLPVALNRATAGTFALVLVVGAGGPGFEDDEDVVERWRVNGAGRVLRSRYDLLDTEHEPRGPGSA